MFHEIHSVILTGKNLPETPAHERLCESGMAGFTAREYKIKTGHVCSQRTSQPATNMPVFLAYQKRSDTVNIS